jgi:NTE family protein
LPGSAFSLSGGGYRAMLFHRGAVWRHNEVGLLYQLGGVSSVFGGSITAGVLAYEWQNLDCDTKSGVAKAFERVVPRLRGLAGRTIDTTAGLSGMFLPGSIAERLAGAYRRHLSGKATLRTLPDPAHGV